MVDRRGSVIIVLVAVVGLLTLRNGLTSELAVPKPGLVSVDCCKLVSRADLVYGELASRSEEGLPLGNGAMGSLVWTSPTALKFQINRVDVFPVNSATNSFPARDSDYGSGCGYVDIDFVDFGEDVFAGSTFRQHLSLYDGLMTGPGQTCHGSCAGVAPARRDGRRD